jgi:hypothetical protein
MAERVGRSGAQRCARFPYPPGWPVGQNRTQSATLLPSVRVGAGPMAAAPAALLSCGARSQAGSLHAASASSIAAGPVAQAGPFTGGVRGSSSMRTVSVCSRPVSDAP